jgi:anti-sigma factor RsiW
MTTRNLTCHELDERLGDYLDGTLDDSSVADMELHLSGCAACASLVRDFESITRQGAALPALAPSHDLWPAIEQRIGTSVLPMPAAPTQRAARAATWQRLRTGAIAAGLMGLTAAVTHSLTKRGADVTAAAVQPAFVSTAPAVADSIAAPASETALASADSVAAPDPAAERELPRSSDRTALVARRDAPVTPTRTYDSEITQLRGVLESRDDLLDPRTVAILESSIATIDSAIAQARSALAGDPASRFLSTQLNKALEKKLGLLRTAALLPART